MTEETLEVRAEVPTEAKGPPMTTEQRARVRLLDVLPEGPEELYVGNEARYILPAQPNNEDPSEWYNTHFHGD